MFTRSPPSPSHSKSLSLTQSSSATTSSSNSTLHSPTSSKIQKSSASQHWEDFDTWAEDIDIPKPAIPPPSTPSNTLTPKSATKPEKTTLSAPPARPHPSKYLSPTSPSSSQKSSSKSSRQSSWSAGLWDGLFGSGSSKEANVNSKESPKVDSEELGYSTLPTGPITHISSAELEDGPELAERALSPAIKLDQDFSVLKVNGIATNVGESGEKGKYVESKIDNEGENWKEAEQAPLPIDDSPISQLREDWESILRDPMNSLHSLYPSKSKQSSSPSKSSKSLFRIPSTSTPSQPLDNLTTSTSYISQAPWTLPPPPSEMGDSEFVVVKEDDGEEEENEEEQLEEWVDTSPTQEQKKDMQSKRRLKKFLKILLPPSHDQSASIDIASLRTLSWSGVPSQLRPHVWSLLLGYLPLPVSRRSQTLARKRQEFADSVRLSFAKGEKGLEEKVWGQIRKDCPRTCPEFGAWRSQRGQDSLARILYIWAIRHPASSYVQGINDLVTPFFSIFLSLYITSPPSKFDLSVLPDEILSAIEADCFWCLSKLLDGIQDNYIFNQPGIRRQVDRMKELCLRVDAPLANHLESQGVEFIHFAFRWMNCLLMRELSVKNIIRMWDTYLAEGTDAFSEFHLYVCLAFLVKWSDKLKGMEFQDIIMFLQSLPTQDWDDKNTELLLSEAFVWKSLFHDAQGHFVRK